MTNNSKEQNGVGEKIQYSSEIRFLLETLVDLNTAQNTLYNGREIAAHREIQKTVHKIQHRLEIINDDKEKHTIE